MFQMGRKIEKKDLFNMKSSFPPHKIHIMCIALKHTLYYCFVMAWIEHRHSQHGVWNSIEVSWIFDLIITFSLLHNSNIRNVVMAPTFFTEFDSPAKPSEIKEKKEFLTFVMSILLKIKLKMSHSYCHRHRQHWIIINVW